MAIFDKGIKNFLKRDKSKPSNKLQRTLGDEKEVAIVTPGIRQGVSKNKWEIEAKLPELPCPPPPPAAAAMPSQQSQQLVPWQQLQNQQYQPGRTEPYYSTQPVLGSGMAGQHSCPSSFTQPVPCPGPLVPMYHSPTAIQHPPPDQGYQYNASQHQIYQNPYSPELPPQPLSPKLAFASSILQPLLLNHPYLLMACLVSLSLCTLHLTLNSVVSIAPIINSMLKTVMRCACFIAFIYAVAVSVAGYFGFEVAKHTAGVRALREVTDAARDGVTFTSRSDSIALQKENRDRRQVKAITGGTTKTKVHKNFFMPATYEIEEAD